MDRKTVFSKTAKGLMEATGKTSALSRDMRAILKEIDGKTALGDIQARLSNVPEAKLQEALQSLAKSDFIRELVSASKPDAAPVPKNSAPVDDDLDFTAAIPTVATIARRAEEAAREQAQAAAAARAKSEVDAGARAVAEAAAKAKAEAEARARIAAEAAARAKAEAEAKARAEAEAKAKIAAAEAAARAKAEAEARARREAEERARREAEEKARKEAQAHARAQEQARMEAEARARKEAEERVRVEAELNARLEAERKAREEAERKAKESAERERKLAEESARREADELRARLEAERKAKEAAELERKQAEEKARREAEDLRAKLEDERKAREAAERRAREDNERRAREDAEREAKERAEREARERAEREAKLRAEREAKERLEREEKERAEREAQERTEREAQERAQREVREREEREAKERAEREAKEGAEREEKERAERVRREAEARARREAEDQARREAEARQRKEAEERSRREAEERAQREAREESEAEAKAREAEQARLRREAEERASREAQEGMRAAAEAEASRIEEERRRKADEEKQKIPEQVAALASADAAAWEQEHAKAQALIAAQDAETERHFAEMEKELEAEDAAAKERPTPPEAQPDTDARPKDLARESARAQVQLQARRAKAEAEDALPVYRTRINWGKPLALGLFLLLIAGLGLVHVLAFDSYIPQFEQLASAHLQQPVEIKSLHLSLVPTPHWRLEGVTAGKQGEFAVERVNAFAELGSMFSDKKAFTSIELESPVLNEQGLLALLFGKPQGQDFKVARISVKNGKLNSSAMVLPVLDAQISMGEDGAWQKIALETPDRKTSLLLEPKSNGAQIEIQTNVFATPFGPDILLENFSAKGTVARDQLKLSEFKGGIYGGYLSGSVNLKWGADWSMGGELSARAMDPGRIAPTLLEEGALEGKALYSMRAKSFDELFAAPRLEGSFTVQKGSLIGVDLARLLQGGGIGGKTAFAELSGNFVRDGGKTQLQQVRLGAGPVSAGGNAEADARKNLNGRFGVELKSAVVQARANLALSGTLKEPRFSR